MRPGRTVASALVFSATAPSALFAQGGGAEGGGGLYDMNTGLSAWTLIVFAILVLLLGKFAWKPILEAVEARERGIKAALDDAAAKNAEAAKLLEEHRAGRRAS
jgi:F-type H+-transporting ATPase subunit b